jgi:hypothetical protein
MRGGSVVRERGIEREEQGLGEGGAGLGRKRDGGVKIYFSLTDRIHV